MNAASCDLILGFKKIKNALRNLLIGYILLQLTGCSLQTRDLDSLDTHTAPARAATKLKNFYAAKKAAMQIFLDHRETFYCGCMYDINKQVDFTSCGYIPKKLTSRSKVIEWEHIVSAKEFAGHLSCWNNYLCKNSKGVQYKGRNCCRAINTLFNDMESDLHNLVPAIGEINAARGAKQFGLNSIHPYEYGSCNISINKITKTVEPRKIIRGQIARSYLYMLNTYDVPISKQQTILFTKWSLQYPPSNWEIHKNTVIKNIQGNSNYYIDNYFNAPNVFKVTAKGKYMLTAQDILNFWFSKEDKWFAKDAEFDQEIKDKFSSVYNAIITGNLQHWQHNPDSMLALIIALDQFPRNMFRDTTDAFASDCLARMLVYKALEQGFDQQLPSIKHKQFLYMPLMHSENLSDQEYSVKLFTSLEPSNSNALSFAIRHRDIIKKFGRFPHRNFILARQSTIEEEQFLQQPGSSF